MARRIILTGTAIVTFKKVITDPTDDDIAELQASVDLQEAQIDEEDLLQIECIHEMTGMRVEP